ncbi:hypothetical protein, partial [Aeromonas caviae]|uniref:hypothetical protein n=1 Tax=Aeromonas caviae TaxID=648 RepID=UPI003F745710
VLNIAPRLPLKLRGAKCLDLQGANLFQNWHGLCFVTLKIKKADINVGQRALAQENWAGRFIEYKLPAELSSVLQCCDLSET